MKTTLCRALLVLLTAGSSASASKLYEGGVDFSWRQGSDRTILMTELWVPLYQSKNPDYLFYGDLRILGDNQDGRELNAGLGARKLFRSVLPFDGIAGGHLWFDRRITDRQSKFHQITAGGEWFSKFWELRANGYWPLDDNVIHEDPNEGGSGFNGQQLFVTTDRLVSEEALSGVDYEFGLLVPVFQQNLDSIRAFAGGFHFDGNRTDNVNGVRTRFTVDITADIQVGGRFEYDNERQSQGFLQATLRFPFGNKKSYRSNQLTARLDERPERDIDIVTRERILDDGLNVPIENVVTGEPQLIFHVDNTSAPGGDGTFESPFHRLADAEAAAGAYDVIYVHRGDGTTTGQNDGIILSHEGQILAGSGTDFSLNTELFEVVNGLDSNNNILIAADPEGAPVISNSSGDGVTITADKTRLSGIIVQGTAGAGVNVQNNSGIAWNGTTTISNVTAVSNASDGFIFQAAGQGSSIANLEIYNSLTDGNVRHGLYSLASAGGKIESVSVNQSTAQNNGENGMEFRSSGNGSTISNAIVFESTASNNGNDGIVGWAETNASQIGKFQITGSESIQNNRRGYYAVSVNGGTINDIIISDNIVNNSSEIGILILLAGTNPKINNVLISDNISTNNTEEGISIFNSSGITETVKISGNYLENNNEPGITFTSQGQSQILNGEIENNFISNNQFSGTWITTRDNGNIQAVSLSGNTIIGNPIGVDIVDDSSGGIIADLGGGFSSTGDNRIFNNTNVDLRVDLDGLTLKAEGNWWGDETGLNPSNLSIISGSVDADPFLSIDPAP